MVDDKDSKKCIIFELKNLTLMKDLLTIADKLKHVINNYILKPKNMKVKKLCFEFIKDQLYS